MFHTHASVDCFLPVANAVGMLVLIISFVQSASLD